MSPWGPASFENDAATEWFFSVEEAVEPGEVIVLALDTAAGEADFLDLATSCEAVAAAELSASCAGEPPERLPDNVRRFAESHPHRPHGTEITLAHEAVARVREESELRKLWNEAGEAQETAWLNEIDDLTARLRRSSAGDPATLSP